MQSTVTFEKWVSAERRARDAEKLVVNEASGGKRPVHEHVRRAKVLRAFANGLLSLLQRSGLWPGKAKGLRAHSVHVGITQS